MCRFTLSNSNSSLVVRILDYGGIITEINVPDRNGQVADVNLGFDDMAGECAEILSCLDPSWEPRREARDVWCKPPVWNLRAVIWFTISVSSLFFCLVLLLFLSCHFSANGPFSWLPKKKTFSWLPKKTPLTFQNSFLFPTFPCLRRDWFYGLTWGKVYNEMWICLWQSLIVLRCPCVGARTLKSSY